MDDRAKEGANSLSADERSRHVFIALPLTGLCRRLMSSPARLFLLITSICVSPAVSLLLLLLQFAFLLLVLVLAGPFLLALHCSGRRAAIAGGGAPLFAVTLRGAAAASCSPIVSSPPTGVAVAPEGDLSSCCSTRTGSRRPDSSTASSFVSSRRTAASYTIIRARSR